MKILAPEQLKRVDKRTILEEKIESVALMERASKAFVDIFKTHFVRSIPVLVLCGPGNNGGDGWCIARRLSDDGYAVKVYASNSSSEDNRNQKKKFTQNFKDQYGTLANLISLENSSEDVIVIDALFGYGLDRPLEGEYKKVVEWSHTLSCPRVSVDIPSGLHAQKGIIGPCFQASLTLTFQTPKRCFFDQSVTHLVGKWQVLDIGLSEKAIVQEDVSEYSLDQFEVKKMWQGRSKFSHKGDYGRALIIAGSSGMMGAAILASRACLRSGIGLMHVHVPDSYAEMMHLGLPEGMISEDKSDLHFTGIDVDRSYDVIAVGPGLGRAGATSQALISLLKKIDCKYILDADALNIIAQEDDLENLLPPQGILTPHPGEFDRLFGAHEDRESRLQTQIEMSEKLGITIILKGRYTSISFPDGSMYYNTTGNAGLAKGGSGDVLTGIMAGLVGRMKNLKHGALTACYLHGYSADLAREELGMEAMLPSDVIRHLGNAFKDNDLL